MPEIGTSGSMSGDGKRGVGHRPQATAPILDSTFASVRCGAIFRPLLNELRNELAEAGRAALHPIRTCLASNS